MCPSTHIPFEVNFPVRSDSLYWFGLADILASANHKIYKHIILNNRTVNTMDIHKIDEHDKWYGNGKSYRATFAGLQCIAWFESLWKLSTKRFYRELCFGYSGQMFSKIFRKCLEGQRVRNLWMWINCRKFSKILYLQTTDENRKRLCVPIARSTRLHKFYTQWKCPTIWGCICEHDMWA